MIKNFNFLNFRFIVPIICGYVLTQFILAETPWYFYIGFAFVVAVSTLFAKKPKNFLIYLFMLRAAIDPFLINVRFSVGGVDLGLGGSLSLLLIAGAGISLVATPASRKVFGPIFFAWLFFCVINVLAIFNSTHLPEALKENIRYLSVLSVLILSIIYMETPKDIETLISTMLYSGVIAIVIGIGYSFINPHPEGRFAATLGHPNILSFYLLILVGLLFAGMGENFSQWQRRSLYFIFFAAIIFTKTRSGWVAFIVMMFFYALFYNRKLLIPGLIFIIMIGFTPFVKEHMDNAFVFTSSGLQVNENGSLGWRLEKWSYLWKAFLESPLKGHGIGSAGQFGKDSLGAHNDYLRYLIETGIFGVVFAYLPYFMMLAKAAGDIKKNISAQMRSLAAFLTIFIPAFLVMSISENLSGYIVIHWYLWAVMGAYIAMDSMPATGVPRR